jgi:dihydroorotate dehydrogenase (fumarate)
LPQIYYLSTYRKGFCSSTDKGIVTMTLETKYMGLTLRNPLIVSSSNLTSTVDGVQKAADAGAGAVVLKSLFEEQIAHDTGQVGDDVDMGAHPEAAEYIKELGNQLGPKDYLDLVREARSKVDIPVIASVNCRTPRWWATYGRQLEEAGADALELNIAIMPTSAQPSVEIEEYYAEIVRAVNAETSLPLAVKIGPYFTSMAGISEALQDAGADALVLFNRFYQLDIDVGHKTITSGYQFSAAEEIHMPLRWTSILSGRLELDLAASTAVYTGQDVIKMLLAGSTAVQICSTVYKNGHERIGKMLADLQKWMEKQGYSDIGSFAGSLSQAKSREPEQYERLQYIKAITGIS